MSAKSDQHWMPLELESQQLLSLCLRRIHGLSKLKLVDARFIWTEPHSKRLKVFLTVKKEVLSNVILQQSLTIEFVVQTRHCQDCDRAFTPQTWKAVVQVRQRVDHKRTFLYLEQLILARQMHKVCIGVEAFKDGMDFYFGTLNAAQRFAAFLHGSVPTKSKTSRKLVSADVKSNTHNNQHTISVEIVPVCKGDLVLVPPKTAPRMGVPSGGLYLVRRLTSVLHLTNLHTFASFEVGSDRYWRAASSSPKPAVLLTARCLVEFVVLDLTPTPTRDCPQLAEVEVARSSDFGRNDRTLLLTTHLG
eukprot:CAMPEP_0113942132 /NCGR_PEP_ID=MMETSP1339-20121228/7901_1 /TAXON_ID=94617 /ORGANISM="Fibrocapsa japonica" /LENGTH=303 /DNA_ID=CAMNT_0000946479 /DNA_START=217 /DNA_END=1125 /DNA_ORIENTATION=- /assembly_acc=CAM_ASM_000762